MLQRLLMQGVTVVIVTECQRIDCPLCTTFSVPPLCHSHPDYPQHKPLRCKSTTFFTDIQQENVESRFVNKAVTSKQHLHTVPTTYRHSLGNHILISY